MIVPIENKKNLKPRNLWKNTVYCYFTVPTFWIHYLGVPLFKKRYGKHPVILARTVRDINPVMLAGANSRRRRRRRGPSPTSPSPATRPRSPSSYSRASSHPSASKSSPLSLLPVLGIREIFVRSRILGSVPLTNGSGIRLFSSSVT